MSPAHAAASQARSPRRAARIARCSTRGLLRRLHRYKSPATGGEAEQRRPSPAAGRLRMLMPEGASGAVVRGRPGAASPRDRGLQGKKKLAVEDRVRILLDAMRRHATPPALQRRGGPVGASAISTARSTVSSFSAESSAVIRRPRSAVRTPGEPAWRANPRRSCALADAASAATWRSRRRAARRTTKAATHLT